MTSFSSYLQHILLAVFDYADVPRIVFRFPYTCEKTEPSFHSLRDEPHLETILLDSLIMYSNLLNHDSDSCRLQLSVDEVQLLGHVDVISNKRCSYVFILTADTPVVVLDRFYEMSRTIFQVYKMEEERCQYVTEECMKKFSPIGSPDNLDNSIYESFFSNSNVGKEMEAIFKALKSGSNKPVRINNLVPLHVSLVTAADFKTDTPVRMYHSLLLIKQPRSLMDILPTTLPQLTHKFLTVINPIRNMEELAQDADIHLDEVIGLSRYFISLGCAKLIYPISRSNIYVLHPSSNISSRSLSNEFHLVFSELSMKFSQLISKFSAARKIEDLLSFDDPLLFKIIAWLLGNDLIIQLHKYIFVMPPIIRSDVFSSDGKEEFRGLKSAGESSRFMFSHSESSFTSPTMELTPESMLHTRSNSTETDSSAEDNQIESLIDEVFAGRVLSWEEREEVEQTLRSRSDGSVQLLRKLVPYFDGTHHVEEILFNEMLSGVCEKDLEKLLIEFSNILITYIRPETV